MHIAGPETRQCPAEFQSRITRMFGTNPFGEPLFKVMWTKSEFIRMGNVWVSKDGTERRGYKDRYKCPTQCWAILRWRSSKEYGSPEMFYTQTYDSYSRLYVTGEYPWKGRYEVLQPLYSKEMRDGKLIIEHLELSHLLIDKIIPLMLRAQKMSYWEKKAANDLARAEQHKKDVAQFAEVMMNELPPWYGPVSFSRQGCRTSLLDRRMGAIQKQWDRLSKGSRRPTFQKSRGFFQGVAPNPN